MGQPLGKRDRGRDVKSVFFVFLADLDGEFRPQIAQVVNVMPEEYQACIIRVYTGTFSRVPLPGFVIESHGKIKIEPFQFFG
jgi:hypothetical protein